MKVYKVLLLLVLMFSFNELYSQDQSVLDLFRSDRKKAEVFFKKKEYNRAVYYYKRVVAKDSSEISNKLRLAECYKFLNNTAESERWYGEVINSSDHIDATHLLHYAEMLLSNGKNAASKFWFEKYYQQIQADKRKNKYLYQTASIEQWVKDSLAFSVKPVNFNSPEADFCPVYFDKGIIFLSGRKSQGLVKNVSAHDNTYFLELYYTEPSRDNYSDPVKFHDDLNTPLHEGSLTIFDKGKKVIFSRNIRAEGKDGHKKLGIFAAELSKNKKKWRNIHELPFNNKEFSVSHPYFNVQTNTLYFISDMPGGLGGTDIYKAFYEGGKWSSEVNLGSQVNTERNEMFPFVSKDSILYFSSNGHGGLGGIDIFMTDLRNDSLEIENLGYPVNSSRDDFSFVHNESSTEGYFASNRKNGGQDDDIYEVKINRVKVEGIVLDKLKLSGIKGAKIRITNSLNKKEQIIYSNQKGIYAFYIIPGRKYSLEIQASGYKPETEEISTNNSDQQVMRVKEIMDKYNKAFVNGKVVWNGEKVGFAKIHVFDPTADTVEVLSTDATGNFQCQINTDTTNIILAEAKGKLGILQVVPHKRKRKSSAVQFIEVSMGTVDSIEVKGIYKKKLPAVSDSSATILVIRNDWTNKEEVLTTNENGNFSIRLWDICRYTIFAVKDEERISIYSFEPIKDKNIELIEK